MYNIEQMFQVPAVFAATFCFADAEHVILPLFDNC